MYYQPHHGPRLVVLAGPTGSGKTAVLEALHLKGFPVINLEQIAQHKGSVFGALGIFRAQPSQPEFEQTLLNTFNSYGFPEFIFTEQEAPAIGKRRIPAWFLDRVQSGQFVHLHLPKAERVRLITQEYGSLPADALCGAIDKLSERLPQDRLQQLKHWVRNDQFPRFAESMLDYYDNSIHYNAGNRADAIHLDVEVFDADKIALRVSEAVGKPALL